jgi:diphthamide biosynthesis protein 7
MILLFASILYRNCSDDRRKLVQELAYESAIFDLHFLSESPNFAVVTNTGDISVFKFFQNEQGICGFELIAAHHLIDAQITYFSWYPYGKEYPPLLAATLHTGKLILARFSDWDFSKVELLDDEEETLASMHGHEESAWCCAWSSSTSIIGPTPGVSGRTLLSGGDDCTLRILNMSTAPIVPDSTVSINTEFDAFDNGRRVFKPHASGVTFILPLPVSKSDVACILLTGGYDDFVRVYTTYDFRVNKHTHSKPRVLAELNLGGGVWRLRFLHNYEKRKMPNDASPAAKFQVLASCAWAGARILEIEGSLAGEWSIKVVGTVTIHQSMCYASDVQPLEHENDTSQESRICVSSSFYDKLLCLWKWDPSRAVVEATGEPLG